MERFHYVDKHTGEEYKRNNTYLIIQIDYLNTYPDLQKLADRVKEELDIVIHPEQIKRIILPDSSIFYSEDIIDIANPGTEPDTIDLSPDVLKLLEDGVLSKYGVTVETLMWNKFLKDIPYPIYYQSQRIPYTYVSPAHLLNTCYYFFHLFTDLNIDYTEYRNLEMNYSNEIMKRIIKEYRNKLKLVIPQTTFNLFYGMLNISQTTQNPDDLYKYLNRVYHTPNTVILFNNSDKLQIKEIFHDLHQIDKNKIEFHLYKPSFVFETSRGILI
jgi:hypothetical protein